MYTSYMKSVPRNMKIALGVVVILLVGVGVYFLSIGAPSLHIPILQGSTGIGNAGNSSRLVVKGSQILLPSGTPVTLHGFVWGSWGTPLQQDAADNVSQGANYVRIPLSWYFGSGTGATDCGTGQDSYDPGAPGNILPANLAILDQEVAWASAAHLWVNLMVRGGDCDFWTNPKVIPQYIQMWQFLANRYKNTPYIGSYELLSEPHPARLSDKSANNTEVKALYERVITAIRTIDPLTPVVVGPAQTYDIRNLEQIYLPDQTNVIYTFNFFEPTAYVKSTKLAKFKGSTGSPGTYSDQADTTTSCSYPGKGQSVLVNQTWLVGLLSCATNFRNAHNLPVYANQVGIFSNVPDAAQYLRDVLGLFNQNGINFTYWEYRAHGLNNANDQAVMYQTSNGTWQTKMDWLNLIDSYFK